MPRTTIETVAQKVDDLRLLILGNGDVEQGICWRLKKVEESLISLTISLNEHIANGKTKNGKKILGTTPEFRNQLEKWFVRTLYIIVYGGTLFVLSKIDLELAKKILESVLK